MTNCGPLDKRPRNPSGSHMQKSSQAKNIKDIVDDYIEEFRIKVRDELSFYKEPASFKEAIEKAALSVKKDRTKHSHQWRLPKSALEQAAKVLKRHSTEIGRYKTFQDLFAAIKAALKPIHGIGELAIYDIALRIGASREIEPENVYLHRGTREGARRLSASTKSLNILSLIHCRENSEGSNRMR